MDVTLVPPERGGAVAMQAEILRLREQNASLAELLSLAGGTGAGTPHAKRPREEGETEPPTPRLRSMLSTQPVLRGTQAAERLASDLECLERDVEAQSTALADLLLRLEHASDDAQQTDGVLHVVGRRASTLRRSHEVEARAASNAMRRLSTLAQALAPATADCSAVNLEAAETDAQSASILARPYSSAAKVLADQAEALCDTCARLREACDLAAVAVADAEQALSGLSARREAVLLHVEMAQDKAIFAYAHAAASQLSERPAAEALTSASLAAASVEEDRGEEPSVQRMDACEMSGEAAVSARPRRKKGRRPQRAS